MSKRRCSQSPSEDEWNASDEVLPSSSESDGWECASKKTKQPTRKKSAAKKKRKTEVQPREMVQSSGVFLHSTSRHSIRSPGPMRIALLQWFTTVKDLRGMPWRKPSDFSRMPEERSQRAYEVWVSEVMLQQTQVTTVIPYYNRWMETFPTLMDLAQANIDQVNALWKGLGYYSRARRLLEGAKKAVEAYGGRLPDKAKEMQQNIPGIGRYSAGAICSIAYGERVPVLDGNVHRLLSRVLALHASPKAKATLNILWDAADAMVREDATDQVSHPGDINQALIELGSTVCKVRSPSCDTCPLRPWCSAYQLAGGEKDVPLPDIEDSCRVCEPLPLRPEVTAFPMKPNRKKAREELDIVNVVEWRPDLDSHHRHFLLVRRPETGLLAGLHDFAASANVSKNLSAETIKSGSLKLLGKLLGCTFPQPVGISSYQECGSDAREIRVAELSIVGDVSHIFSHIKKTYTVVWILVTGGLSPPEPYREIKLDKSSGKVAKGQGKQMKSRHQKTIQGCSDPHVECMWTLLDQVADATLGTGSMKVWNVAKNHWEKVAHIH